MPELGFYALGGHVESPREMYGELALAERLGLGTAFFSERFNVKELEIGRASCRERVL